MFYLKGYFFSLKFVGIVCIGIDFAKTVFVEKVFSGAVFFTSMISSHITIELPIILSKHLPFHKYMY